MRPTRLFPLALLCAALAGCAEHATAPEAQPAAPLFEERGGYLGGGTRIMSDPSDTVKSDTLSSTEPIVVAKK